MENLAILKKERTQLRRMFTKTCREIDGVVIASVVDKTKLLTCIKQLEDKSCRLFVTDEKIREKYLSLEKEEEQACYYEQELPEVENYRDEWTSYQVICEKYLKESIHVDEASSCASSTNYRRRIQLPKLELKKFNGDVRNWISFWSQFKKIHLDTEIDDEDKFQYLIQGMEEGSPAAELINSFPPSSENYTKAIEQLRTRFARDEFLIETYVRELLNIVLQQALKTKKGMSLSSLYDKLTTQLLALESLGVTTDKYAAMLYPLVESALPDSLLLAWERCKNNKRFSTGTNNPESDSILNQLLTFLRDEVQSEERINRAKTGFSTKAAVTIKRQPKEEDEEFSTAATIVSTEPKVKSTTLQLKDRKGEKAFPCLFCEKVSHTSQECFKAHDLTLDERKDIVKKKKSCFRCLKPNHSVNNCKTFVKCLICGKRHYAIMCLDLQQNIHSNSQNNQNITPVLSSYEKRTETLLQTVMVNLKNGHTSKKIRVLIDSGSQRSYILDKYITELEIPEVGEEVIVQCVFGGHQSKPQVAKLYDIFLENVDNTFEFKLRVMSQNIICNHIPNLADKSIIALLHNKNIILTDICENMEISVLLGADIIGNLLTGNLEKIAENLLAIETKLGWTLIGQQNYLNNNFHQSYLSNLTITDLWNLDSIGIKDPVEVKTKQEKENYTLEQFVNTITLNQEMRYEVCLPWKDGHLELQNNQEIARMRLKNTSKKLTSMNRYDEYNSVFLQWEESDIIEEVTRENKQIYDSIVHSKGSASTVRHVLNHKTGPSHYLPHHAVIKDSSTTTKVRPVFDASCKDTLGNSLNACLEKGPNLLELIPSLLLKFRLYSYGVTSDIKQAFLQISIRPQDRDVLRFLWWENSDTNEIKIYRHCRVVFGLTCSPFLLSATINYHLDRAEEEMAETAFILKNSFYVDNCVNSFDTKEGLEKFVKESKLIMSKGKFDLRGWVSNLDSDLVETTSCDIVPLLGLSWDIKSDTLYCNMSELDKLVNIPKTKRGLLSAAQRVFDPIGFCSPVTLVPKLILQKIWKLKLNWDSELPDDLSKQFSTWLKGINLLAFCGIPRKLSNISLITSNSEKFSLPVFSDASKVAYSACIFLRSDIQGHTNIELIQAKSRVAPAKDITLPRLELLGALIGVRLCQSVKLLKVFSTIKTFYWCDSTIVLTWIKKVANWSVFVNNRISEIRLAAESDQWFHVPGDQNPADLLSRGCQTKFLIESKWWEGPDWLKGPKGTWPNTNIVYQSLDVEQMELNNLFLNDSVLVTTNENQFSHLFSIFSSYIKIVRTVAWIYRFYKNVSTRKKIVGELTTDEVDGAELKIIKLIQKESFPNEIFYNLEVFRDENNILRVKTKLFLGDDPYNFRYPILLPSDHEIVEKMIKEQHRILKHIGVQTLLQILREKFWILRGKKTLNKVLSKCVICKRHKSKPIQVPAAPLPIDRFKTGKAFNVTGVDLAGPLYIKENEKVWIVLFTCSVYRAIHLELVRSLSTDCFLMALRRFIARRGRISTIYSDNGTNFVGTNNRLKGLNWNHILSFSSVHRISWKFNVPAAPWWGGWWERLIRLVKELLRKNLGRARLNYEELITLLCDCEALINARPLTYITNEDDVLIPLSPSSFLQDITITETPDLDEIDRKSMVKRYKYLQTLRENLRTRFKKEYLAELVQSAQKKSSAIKVGDIVLVEIDNLKRIFWPLGKIIEVHIGKDGIPRVARVKLADREVIRPLQRIFPLEISVPQEDNVDEHKIQEAAENLDGIKENSKPYRSRAGREIQIPTRFHF